MIKLKCIHEMKKSFKKISARMIFKNKIGSIRSLTLQHEVMNTHNAFMTRELVRSLYKDCDRLLRYSGSGIELEKYLEDKNIHMFVRQ